MASDTTYAHLPKPHRFDGERRSGDATRIAAALAERGRISLRVRGNSMLPWLRPGDIVVVKRAELNSVERGDVVLFRAENRTIVHRIVATHGSQESAKLFVKGDACADADGFIASRHLLGRMVRLYRGGRRIDFQSPRRMAFAKLIALLSLYSNAWLPLARFAAIATRPGRRMLSSLRLSLSASR
ncbi:MAG TPA: signal peptidase I [Candidatus Acidoferrum sp.]|jgi:signal peptidase I